MHLCRFGKADGLARQSLHAGAQRQMFPLDLLSFALAWRVHIGIEMARIRAIIIGVLAGDTKRR